MIEYFSVSWAKTWNKSSNKSFNSFQEAKEFFTTLSDVDSKALLIMEKNKSEFGGCISNKKVIVSNKSKYVLFGKDGIDDYSLREVEALKELEKML